MELIVNAQVYSEMCVLNIVNCLFFSQLFIHIQIILTYLRCLCLMLKTINPTDDTIPSIPRIKPTTKTPTDTTSVDIAT